MHRAAASPPAFMLIATLSVLAWLPLAGAQMAPVSFELAGTVPTQAVAPGNMTMVSFTITRICPNVAMVLDQQVVQLTVSGPDSATVSGPGQVIFASQACAQQSRQAQEAAFTVALSRDAEPGSALAFKLVARPQGPASPGSSPGGEVTQIFTVGVAQPVAMEAAAEPNPQEAPMLPSALLAAALLASAFVLRRRWR